MPCVPKVPFLLDAFKYTLEAHAARPVALHGNSLGIDPSASYLSLYPALTTTQQMFSWMVDQSA